MNTVCKMCLENKKLVDAHIIPKSFYKSIKTDNQPLEIHTNKKGEYTKRSHTGIYDKTILCSGCEKLFQRYDDYAQNLLLPDAKEEDYILDPDGKRGGYKLENIDYHDLKLFFLSVLWRASVSIREEFSKIDVGPFEETLKTMIQEDNPGDLNEFSITITRFDDYFGKNFLLNPHPTKLNGINYYIFYLGAGYKIYIKVDKRPLLGELATIILKPNQPLYIPFNKNFTASKELNIFREILKKNG